MQPHIERLWNKLFWQNLTTLGQIAWFTVRIREFNNIILNNAIILTTNIHNLTDEKLHSFKENINLFMNLWAWNIVKNNLVIWLFFSTLTLFVLGSVSEACFLCNLRLMIRSDETIYLSSRFNSPSLWVYKWFQIYCIEFLPFSTYCNFINFLSSIFCFLLLYGCSL